LGIFFFRCNSQCILTDQLLFNAHIADADSEELKHFHLSPTLQMHYKEYPTSYCNEAKGEIPLLVHWSGCKFQWYSSINSGYKFKLCWQTFQDAYTVYSANTKSHPKYEEKKV